MSKIRVLIVDDHQVVREGLQRILAEQPDIDVAGEAADIASAARELRAAPCDVMLLDISLSGRSGFELLKSAKQEHPHLRVLVLTAHAEDQYALRAIRLGADGFVNKEALASTLVAAIRKVAGGGKFVSEAVAEKLVTHLGDKQESAPHDLLSEREFWVLKLIVAGKSINEIAEQLNLSPKTISTYRARIVDKTGLRSDAELTRYAMEQGLID